MVTRMIALLVFTAAGAFAAQAEPPLVDDNFNAACEVLKSALAEARGLSAPDKYWYCEETGEVDRYVYTMALKSNKPRTDGEEVYSNLLGWYAVARRSQLAFELDINNDRLLPLRSEKPGRGKSRRR